MVFQLIIQGKIKTIQVDSYKLFKLDVIVMYIDGIDGLDVISVYLTL